jgi:hypothetical protein
MKHQSFTNFFVWSDAWIFTALHYSHKSGDKIDLSSLMRAADMLNHAIFTIDELNNAMVKLHIQNIIEIINNTVIYTDLGEHIINKTHFKPGGLFSRVDISLRALNSLRVSRPVDENPTERKSFSEVDYNNAYKQYYGEFNKILEKIL